MTADIDTLEPVIPSIFTRIHHGFQLPEQVGLEPPPKGRRELTDDELTTELQCLAGALDKIPSTMEMKKHGKYSYLVYYIHFGSWPEALDAANLDSR